MKKSNLQKQSHNANTDYVFDIQQRLLKLKRAEPTLIHLRDGELVLYRRAGSHFWHCSFKLQNKKRVRTTTKKMSIEQAIPQACLIYDEARFRHRLGLAHKSKSCTEIAQETVMLMKKQLDQGMGKVVYKSYITCIEKYFMPYFKDHYFEQLTHKDIVDFELWRNRQMQKTPKSSTLRNFASAWNKMIDTAVQHGWLTKDNNIPSLSTVGVKGTSRPAFNEAEIKRLLDFLPQWSTQGRSAIEQAIRPLLWDYVEILLYTGIRHGTEALNIRWKDIQWYKQADGDFLRIWVSGKTGGRWIIAKHQAVDTLKRLHQRIQSIQHLTFEELLSSNVKDLIFTTDDGYQPRRLDGTFKKLLRDMDMIYAENGQHRTLYSLRHTYATFELLNGRVDIHTLAKQMGNSAAMIEKHYSKLTATMAAKRLA
jgi:integrase